MKRILITCPAMADFDAAPVVGFEIVFTMPPGGQFYTSQELMEAGVAQFDAVVAGDDVFDEAVFAAAPRLKIVSKFGHGTDSIDKAAAERHGVAVTNTPGVFSSAVAEATLGYIIYLARLLGAEDAEVKAGRWSRRTGFDLEQVVVGVVGVGSIGQALARRAGALGIRLLGNDPVDPPRGFLRKTKMRMAALEDLLGSSDVVTLHCDLNPTSRGLIGERELGLMKEGSFLINTARGPVVVEEALALALAGGRLAGAALDVFEREPLPADSPLRALDNVIFGAHGTFLTRDSVRRAGAWALRNAIEHLEKLGGDNE